MVKNCINITDSIFSTDIIHKREQLIPVGAHAYPYRTMTLSSKHLTQFGKYMSKIKITQEDNIKLFEVLMKQYQNQYDTLISEPNIERYYNACEGVCVDRYYLLEALGAPKSAKKYQATYTLAPYFAEMLAYLVQDTNIDIFKSKLVSNCRKYGVNYQVLSQAFTSADTTFLKNIDLRIFLDVSTELNNYIMYITYTNSSKLNNGDIFVKNIVHLLLILQQTIFSFIIKEHLDDREGDNAPYLTSKGANILVFQTNQFIFLPTLQVKLGNIIQFNLESATVVNKTYISHLVGGEL